MELEIQSSLQRIEDNSIPDFNYFNGMKMHRCEPVSIETVRNVIL